MRPRGSVRLTDERRAVSLFGGPGAIFELGARQLRYVLGAPSIWQPSRRYPAFLASRASGKTHGLLVKAIALALANPGRPGVIYTRTVIEADQTHIPLLDDLIAQYEERSGHALVASYNKGLRCYRLVNGSQISFRPWGRPKKARGPTLAWALVDEIMFGEVASEEAWRALVYSVRGDAPSPCLGWVSSPDGLRGVTKLFVEKQRDPLDHDHYLVTSTMYDAVDGGWLTMGELEAFKASSSKTSWAIEGLGQVLRPRRAVYAAYDEDVHLLDWIWRDDYPWVLAVDWLTVARGIALAIQVVPRAMQARTVSGVRVDLAPGTWVVARELVVEESTRPEFRGELLAFVRSCGRQPVFAATDRAAPAENAWLRAKYPSITVDSCDSRLEQRVVRGIAMVQSMLDPAEGRRRLYVASTLARPDVPELPGIRAGLTYYGWQADPRDPNQTLDVLEKGGRGYDDPCDALRYAVVQTAGRPEYHGGAPLPYVDTIAEVIREGYRAG